MRDGYVPNLKVPGKKGPSARMWLTLLLCVVLPPVGLILLWGGVRCPVRGKVWMTILSAAIMVAAMTLFLESRNQSALVVPPAAVTYSYTQPTPTAQPTPVPVPNQAVGGEEQGQMDPEQGLADGVIPANPLG